MNRSYEPAESGEGIGCRGATLTAVWLVGAAAVLWTVGLLLTQSSSCTGSCEWLSLTLLFAGGPVSAIFTVIGGTDVVIGWPVDIIAWVMIGVLHQKLSHEAELWTSLWRRWALRFITIALLYGSVMALLVTRVR